MLRVCRACKPNQYTLKLRCPGCGGFTVNPYGSTSTYRPASGRSLKQLVEAYPPDSDRPVKRIVKDIEPRDYRVTASYGLIHTLGRTRLDELGGDGAYSRWMQQHFSTIGHSQQGCVCVDQLIHDGPVGNIKNEDLPRDFNPGFLLKFEALIGSERYRTVHTVILNWHIRFTNGTPNGWTGRGMNPELVVGLRRLCELANKKLGIVYTVHEASELQAKLCSPTGVIALNPAVGLSVDRQFPGTTRYLSKVPGLLRSTHTFKIDLILKLVGAYLSPIDIESPSSNLYFAHGQQVLRLQHGAERRTVGLQGIVIFGMIMTRHGLSVENVTLLSDCMDRAGLSVNLKIVIAGKESDDKLVKALKELARTKPRVHFLGQLGDFGQLAGCRYALSLDDLGYRDNASAMVNVLREGHLLFSRRNGETAQSLVDGAVKTMLVCERSVYMYLELLAKQQPRMRSTSPEVVGTSLDGLFKQIAGALSNSQ